MLPYREHRFGAVALGMFFLLLIGYTMYAFADTIRGPHITVPNEVLVVHEPYVTIRGEAKNIAELQMNGRTISVTEAGAFQEPYVLNQGQNTVILDARDNYGRTHRETMLIVYAPEKVSPTTP